MADRYDTPLAENTETDGAAFERYIIEKLHERGITATRCETRDDQVWFGDTFEGHEIKLDKRCTETGRLSIEIAEKTKIDALWCPSGIHAGNTAQWYIQGNYERAFCFSRNWLVRQFEERRPAVKRESTIMAFYMRFAAAEHYCEFEIVGTVVPEPDDACKRAWKAYWENPGDATMRAALDLTECIQKDKAENVRLGR